MLVHPSHREKRGTLLNGLVHHLNRNGGRAIRPGLVHRLDKETSGLIVVAKNGRSHRILARHFLRKRVEKRYIALVEGVVNESAGEIDAPIGRFAELKHWTVKHDGKHAMTRFWVRERYVDTTLLELEPVTGRTNQLRIHCESIGHPVVGDTRRGGRPADRLYLHAARLTFPDPTTNEAMSFKCEQDFPAVT
jgi:23S rRNA pseudouridine1911/1915/1917 synthase